MLLRRTRAKWKHSLKEKMFDALGMQAMLDQNELHAQEDHMGFRGQLPEHRRFQLAELQRRGLKPEHSVLEIGCGPLTAAIPLISMLNPGKYVGVDVRESVLNLGWQLVGKSGLSGKNPRLIRSDDFAASELPDVKFDFVWSFSVLYHLSDDILDACFSAVSQRLTPNGRYFANVQTNMEDSTWLQFPFLRRPVSEYAEVAARHGLSCRDLGSIAELGFGLKAAESSNRFLEFSRLT